MMPAIQTLALFGADASAPLHPLVVALVVFVLAIFVGFAVINRVPVLLHTPLTSGSNAISGITIVGALLAAYSSKEMLHGEPLVGTILGTLAVMFATINVVGGYVVTDRMLRMFKSGKENRS